MDQVKLYLRENEKLSVAQIEEARAKLISLDREREALVHKIHTLEGSRRSFSAAIEALDGDGIGRLPAPISLPPVMAEPINGAAGHAAL